MPSFISPSNACSLPSGESESSPLGMFDWSFGTLAILLLVTFSFAWLRDDPQFATSPPWYWEMKLAWGTDADLVIVGDSTVYRGLNPKKFEDNGVASHAINFGFSSASLSSEYLFDAASKLNPNSRKKYLVVGVTHWALTPQARKSNGYIDAQINKSKRRTPISWVIALDSIIQKLTPLEINAIIHIPNLPAAHVRANESEYIQDYHMNGWVGSNYVNSAPERGLEVSRSNFGNNNFVDTVLIDEAKDTLQKIQDHDGVMIVLVTMRSGLADSLNDELGKIPLLKLAQDLCPSKGKIVEFHPNVNDSYDGVHLTRRAADKLSESLAQQLIELLHP